MKLPRGRIRDDARAASLGSRYPQWCAEDRSYSREKGLIPERFGMVKGEGFVYSASKLRTGHGDARVTLALDLLVKKQAIRHRVE